MAGSRPPWPLADDRVVPSSPDVESDGLLADQIDYYRRRASEYDETSLEDLEQPFRIPRALMPYWARRVPTRAGVRVKAAAPAQ